MAKKKSRQVVKKAGPAKIPTIFDCPKCSGQKTVEIRIKRV